MTVNLANEVGNIRTISSTFRFVNSKIIELGQDRRGGKEKEKKEMSVEVWNGERTLLFWPLK